MEALGNLSIYSATQSDIQKQIARVSKGNKQRRISARLNQLLKYIDRKIKLRSDKKLQPLVHYLNLTDFQAMLKYIDDPVIKLIHEVAFYTGCRAGEIFAIESDHIHDKVVTISSQIDRDGNTRHTKTRNIRKAFILPEGAQSVSEWAQIQDKLSFRNLKLSEITKRACTKAFPSQKNKHLVFHDLRHSYAIHLLKKGVSLSLIAQSLGNSIQVCQEHYAGFSLNDDSIEAIGSILGRKN